MSEPEGIHGAAMRGDDEAVRRSIASDPAGATAKGGPRGWDPLTYLCFSGQLRLNADDGAGFLRAAQALLDAGADPNTGFREDDHRPNPEWQSVLYAAAARARHPGLTRLLLERGADPNDAETPYHVPETYDNTILTILLDSGKLNPASLATMLLRKADWHDLEGVRLLLQRGAEPNRMTVWGHTALHQALRRDNAIEIVEALLKHGGDPILPNAAGLSSIQIAARRGRGDALHLFRRRGFDVELSGADALASACAMQDEPRMSAALSQDGGAVAALLLHGGRIFSAFAGNGNTGGIGLLLTLGIDIASRDLEGDTYFGIAPNSTALHSAAWRARHETVRRLIEHGAPVDARDGQNRTPLALAVKACVDSYWTARRSPDSVAALLAAGASVDGTAYPSGYDEVDALLKAHLQ